MFRKKWKQKREWSSYYFDESQRHHISTLRLSYRIWLAWKIFQCSAKRPLTNILFEELDELIEFTAIKHGEKQILLKGYYVTGKILEIKI